MSLPEKIEIECPKCGEKRETVVWRSINVTLNPKLKEDLFNGHLNVFHCQKCEEEAFVPTDLLYHDMDKRFFVQYYPVAWLEDDEFLKTFSAEGEVNVNGIPKSHVLDYQKRTHIVFDIAELVRYVIFRDLLYEHTPRK